jgi:aminocarboxymuconate-semialdehyde decarboxylase
VAVAPWSLGGLFERLPSEYQADAWPTSGVTRSPTTRPACGLVERVGAGQVLLGGDHPFDMGEPDPVGKVKTAITDEATQTAILGATAARLRGIKAS